MDAGASIAFSVMNLAARYIQDVARQHYESFRRSCTVKIIEAARLRTQWQFNFVAIEPPSLVAMDLKDQHIVGIEMRPESIRIRRRNVYIALRMLPNIAIDIMTKLIQFAVPPLHAF